MQQAKQVQYYSQQQQQMQPQQQKQPSYPIQANEEPEPTMIQCSQCKQSGLTKIKSNSINLVSFSWCFFTGLFCCLIPGCCKNQSNVTHYCPHCNSNVGEKSATCC